MINRITLGGADSNDLGAERRGQSGLNVRTGEAEEQINLG